MIDIHLQIKEESVQKLGVLFCAETVTCLPLIFIDCFGEKTCGG
jgi:hypothetical protein